VRCFDENGIVDAKVLVSDEQKDLSGKDSMFGHGADVSFINGFPHFKNNSFNGEFSIMADTREKSLTVYSGGLDFNVFCKRQFNFENDKEYKMRVILLEGQLEIYIDDVLIIQNAFKTKNMNFGLIVGCDFCAYKDFKIHNLEV